MPAVSKTTWKTLNGVGSSKVIRSSFIWIIIVPVLAKAFNNLENSLKLSILGNIVSITLELPFNWTLFYFSALVFALATAIYILRCPTIVREFRDFHEFISTGRELAQLADYLEPGVASNVVFLEDQAEVPPNVAMQRDHNMILIRPRVIPSKPQYLTDMVRGMTDKSEMNRLPQLLSEELIVSNVFWEIWNRGNHGRPKWRMFCLILYVLGFVLLGFVLVQNLGYVIRALL